jgi:hypothetical protein
MHPIKEKKRPFFVSHIIGWENAAEDFGFIWEILEIII